MSTAFSALCGLIVGLHLGNSLTHSPLFFRQPGSAITSYVVHGRVRTLDLAHNTLIIDRTAPSTSLRLPIGDADIVWASISKNSDGSRMHATRSQSSDLLTGMPITARVENAGTMNPTIIILYPDSIL